MSRILFTTFGSHGDLHPYLAVGTELRRRGHHVTIGTSPSYRGKVEAQGLAFAPIRPDVSLDDRELLAYVVDPRRGSERIMRMLSSVIRESYADSLPAVAEADTVVTHPITFASVLAAQKLGRRWISSVLAPISFLTAYEPPVPPNAPWLMHLHALGPGAVRGLWSLGKWVSLRWVRPILELRKEIGLAPAANPIFEGSHSPALVLALFSELFAPPQADWPCNAMATGFPFLEWPGGTPPLDPELQRFFREGPAPVVFTLGSSAVGAAGNFYTESLEAVRRLGVRAVFLTGTHPQGLPLQFPEDVLAWPYAPHEAVFPRASAIVHSGGVGTTAQALRSGRPMLTVPFAHDQFDNAERVRRIGAGEVLHRSRYTAQRAERVLRRILEDPALLTAAAAAANYVQAENGARTAADAIEAFLD